MFFQLFSCRLTWVREYAPGSTVFAVAVHRLRELLLLLLLGLLGIDRLLLIRVHPVAAQRRAQASSINLLVILLWTYGLVTAIAYWPRLLKPRYLGFRRRIRAT